LILNVKKRIQSISEKRDIMIITELNKYAATAIYIR
jgi:hypothetical protein